MENNQGPRDNSSDSENSEWAVIDEDASLEWNDEAKYHFRSPHHKSVTKETGLPRVHSPALSGNTSDEDSIEIVSDVANDDHITDDVGNVESQDDEEDTTDEVKSPDIPLHDGNEMVWYHLGERNAIADERSDAISDRANKKKQNALNLTDSWDLVAILIVALIGGFAVGYFCGNTGSQHQEAAPSHLLVNKLQCAVANMRWHQNRLRRASAGLQASTACRRTPKLFNSATSHPPVQPLGSIEAERTLEGDGPLLPTYPSHTQVKPDAVVESKVNDEVEEGIADDDLANIDLSVLADLDQIDHQVEGEYADEDVEEGFAPEVISSDPLRKAIEKISHLGAITEKFPNFDRLSSNVEFLKRVDFSLEVLDSILKTVPLQQTNKVTNHRQEVEKRSKKLLRRIDKSVGRFAKHLSNKLDESKSVLLKKLCKHWSVADNENHFATIELANTVFEECAPVKPRRAEAGLKAPVATNVKHNSKPPTHKVAHEPLVGDEAVKPAIDVKQRKKVAHEATMPAVDVKQRKKSGETTRSKREATAKIIPTQEKRCTGKKADCRHEPREVHQNTASVNQHQPGKRDKKIPHKETPLSDNYKKVDRRKSTIVTKETVISQTEEGPETPLPVQCGTETSEDLGPRTMTDDFNNEYNMGRLNHLATGIGKGNDRGTDYQSDAPKARNKASDNVTSSMSGEWVLRMGNGRAKQRQNDHQSDWLFERAQSRKCHRGNKDCKESMYTKHIPSEGGVGANSDTRKERKHWLKNAIPKRLVEAAKTAKNAFNEFRHNLKQRVRFQ